MMKRSRIQSALLCLMMLAVVFCGFAGIGALSVTAAEPDASAEANWTDQTYTVTLKAGDGAGDDVEGASIAQGASMTIPECPNHFTAPTGKKFAGWSVKIGDAEAETKMVGDSIDNVTANVTLTALWEDRYVFTQTPSAASGLTYNSTKQQLITAGVASEGTVQYQLNGGAWGTEVPVATNAGTYNVSYRIFASESEYANGSLKVEISQKQLTLEWSNTTLTYNGEEQLPTAEIVDGGVMGSDTVNVTVTFNGFGASISANNNYLALASIDNNNYTLTNPRQTFVIEKQSVPIPVIDSVVYNGEDQKPDLTDTDLYSVDANEGGTNAGEYDVVLRLNSPANYKWEDTDEDTLTVTFVIEKCVLDQTFESDYTGEAQQPEIFGGSPFKLITTESFTNAGEYEIVLELIDTANYVWKTPSSENDKLTTTIFTIAKAENTWITVPSLDDWHFGDTPSTPQYEAKFNNDSVKILYLPAGGMIDAATETVPTEEGQYVAIFSVEESENYLSLRDPVGFEILYPRVVIGGWILPPLHYMDTNGIISETQPEGGYAYVRADGTLVLNNFVIDASIFAEAEGEDAAEGPEEFYEYEHLFYGGFSSENSEDSLIGLSVDSTVLLLGENELTGCGSALAILSHECDMTLRGGSLSVDGGIIAEGHLTVEGCTIMTQILYSAETLTVISSKIFAAGDGMVVCGTLTLTDSIVESSAILVNKNATVENSTVQTDTLFADSENEAFGKVTVRNSRMLIDGMIGIVANELVAEDSVFLIEATDGYAIHAYTVAMTDCEITIGATVIGFMSDDVELTDCKVTAESISTLFLKKTEDAYSTVVLNNCEIEASSTDEVIYLVNVFGVTVNGGKLTLKGVGMLPLIACDSFSATDAEIALTYEVYGIQAYSVDIRNTELTVTQAETATAFGTAVSATYVTFVDSTVTVTGGMIGITGPEENESSNQSFYNTKLEIVLKVSDAAAALPAPSTEGEGAAAPVYIGINTDSLEIYGTESVLSVTFPKDAVGTAIRYSYLYCDHAFVISAPEDATFELITETYYAPVLRDGDTVTYPNAVTVSYVEPEADPDNMPEDMVVVGGVELSNGDYLDNEGNITTEKPEGGYAHLLDGVLTLHDFVYYGGGYLYDKYDDVTYNYCAGIYSVNALTVRVEGKNLLDVSTFAGGRDTDGITVCVGDLTVEGYGTLEILATDNGIDVYGDVTVNGITLKIRSNGDEGGIMIWGDLAAKDCSIDVTADSVGIVVYNVLLENCELALNALYDAIYAEGDIILVDCTGEITSVEDDGIYGDDLNYGESGITLIDCTLTITAGTDAIDAETELTMIGCELELVVGDNGIEYDDNADITDCVLYITAADNGISGDSNATLTNCALTIQAGDDGFDLDEGSLRLIGCTGTVDSGSDGIYIGMYASVTIADSTLTVMAYSDGIDFWDIGDVTIRDSVVTISANVGCGIYICDGDVTVSNSRLTVRSYYECIKAYNVTLTDCRGSLFSGEYYIIEAYRVRLSNCELELEAWYDPLIDAIIVLIDGKNTNIEGYCADGLLFEVYDDSLINIDPELIFRDLYYDYPVYLDPESGRLINDLDDTVYEFSLSFPVDDTEDEDIENLIIGGKELKPGQYLDNQGNVSDEMPAGGFAYFNGSELFLKSFTYEGVGTALTTFNGELITAGIYGVDGLTIRLIGENSLKLTSDNTVGIALGDGDLTVTGDGSLTLDTTGKGIDLLGDLTVENVTLTVDSIDTAVKALNISFSNATVTVHATGAENTVGIEAIGSFDVRDCELTVNAESDTADDAVAIVCHSGSMRLVDSTVTLMADFISVLANQLDMTDCDLTVTVNGENAIGLYVNGVLMVTDSTLNVTLNDGIAILVNTLEFSDELTVLIPEEGTIEAYSEQYFTVYDTNGDVATWVIIGVSPKTATEGSVTVRGVALADGEYLDNDGNVSTEKPEGGYAYLKDGVLTLNSFTYLAKKYDSYDGIYSETDLTLVLIGENLLNSYNQYGIYVDGDLTVNGNGSLTVETKAIGIYVENTLTVDLGGITVTAGVVAVEARGVELLGGEIALAVSDGDYVLAAHKSITVGELLEISSPEGATLQKMDGKYVFVDARGNAITLLALAWATHDCMDEDAVDHLCDICGKEYPTCTDADTDHVCDACGGEVGYHADTNGDHICEYGCSVTIGVCADADTDHDCDYGCDKVFGEHKAADGSHVCDYCNEEVTDCTDTDSNHICDVCGDELKHSYSDTWKSDADLHWHECTECGNKIHMADHTFGEWTVTKEATATEKGSKTKSCACGFTVEEEIPATGDGEGLGAGAIVAIVIGAAAVAGVGGFAIWWFVISKRTLVQLGASCKGLFGKK